MEAMVVCNSATPWSSRQKFYQVYFHKSLYSKENSNALFSVYCFEFLSMLHMDKFELS